jgi:aminopeptidase YwaD
MTEQLIKKADTYLHKLCVEIANRRVGSDGNRAATDFFTEVVASFGFGVETAVFDCIDWQQEGVLLTTVGAQFEAFASPYSLGCMVEVPLVVINNVAELEAAPLSGKIVLLRGEIATEQLMPKNFPFYNPDHHRQIIALLESKQPQAIIAATTQDVAMVGSGIYPFPLIEDGDFDIPSVYMTAEEGERLAAYAGQLVTLESRARRIPAAGVHVIARKGDYAGQQVVLFAHIDAKMGTPGAADNAAGVVILLLLAESLATYRGNLSVEIVPLNGEDYYNSPGEQYYLAANAGRFDDILLGINIDGVGFRLGKAAYSLYNCPPQTADLIHHTFARFDQIVTGEPWYAGDHGLFLLHRRPALALTSEKLTDLMAVVHTAADRPEIINTGQLVAVAAALYNLLMALDG